MLIALAFAASQFHPGFAAILALILLLLCLLAMRFFAHLEGYNMLKEAETRGKTGRGPLMKDLAITVGITAVAMLVLFWSISKIPTWLWFAGAS